jgi:putative transposase
VSDKFALIAAEQADDREFALPVGLMCQALHVSRSGFYDWDRAEPSARAVRRAKIAEHVKAAFILGRGTYGVRRVHAVLTHSDDPEVASVSLDLVRNLMQENDLHACQPRAYKVTTISGQAPTPAIADHVKRDFTASAPGTRLVGDITYVRAWTGWLYLATVIDCHTKAVVGWSMADHMRTDLICEAITMAAANVELAPGAVFHSDRGAQYTSAQFAAHLSKHNMVGSMGRTGICWDNAMAESFFAALKNELIYRTAFPTRESARRAIAEYIEVFYNRIRLHSGLGYRTPHEVATEYHKKQLIAA